MNRLPTEKRAQLVSLLIEGTSLRAASRISGVAFNTVLKFAADVGRAAAIYQDQAIRNLASKRVQVDEIWSFCYAKDKNVGYAGRSDAEAWASRPVQEAKLERELRM